MPFLPWVASEESRDLCTGSTAGYGPAGPMAVAPQLEACWELLSRDHACLRKTCQSHAEGAGPRVSSGKLSLSLTRAARALHHRHLANPNFLLEPWSVHTPGQQGPTCLWSPALASSFTQ